MKQTIKISLLFLLTLAFINCSKDDHLENHTQGTHNHNNEVSFKQFKNETGINKFDYYKKANISKSTDFQAKTIESEFITDTTGIKKYVDPINNKTTYSFKIYPIAETLSSNEYYNLVYEKIGTEWNEIIFFNTEKTDSTDGGELESSEMVYNRVSGREGFTEVITYSFHCTQTGPCAGGSCDMCNLCVSTHVTYVYTGIEDSGDGSNGNPPGEGNPPSNGGEGNGIYIPNPYDGETDPNNADFMLAGQVASFTNTLPNNLQTLISNYPFVYPYLVDFCRNNGYTVNSRNTQKMTTALTNFYNFQLNTSYTNLTFVNIDRFNFWAFYTFLNKNNNSFNDITPKINDIKSFVQAADHETANSTVDYLFENKEDVEAVDFVEELIDFYNEENVTGNEDLKNKIKQAITNGITSTAELTHKIFKKFSDIAEQYPSSITYINHLLETINNAASTVTNTNPETCTFADLFNMWLFELGSNPIVINGSNTTSINQLKAQEGVSQARNIALSKIQNDDFSITNHTWTYGQGEFYDGMSNGNFVTAFLGSYSTKVTISSTPNGYQLNFQVTNTSSWDSATRFRIDNDGNGVHDGVFPNTYRNNNNDLSSGGNFTQIWNWSEPIN